MTKVRSHRATVHAIWLALRRRGGRQNVGAGLDFLRARWYFRRATRLGTARLRGRALVINAGSMEIGDRVRMEGTTVRLEIVCFREARLSIGEGTFINYGSNISATHAVSIGKNCAIGQYSIIMDNDYHQVGDHTRPGFGRSVVIEDDVWLGARTIVLPGSHIGLGAVIGANSVVRGVIPAHSLAAGSPARVIRQIDKVDPR